MMYVYIYIYTYIYIYIFVYTYIYIYMIYLIVVAGRGQPRARQDSDWRAPFARLELPRLATIMYLREYANMHNMHIQLRLNRNNIQIPIIHIGNSSVSESTMTHTNMNEAEPQSVFVFNRTLFVYPKTIHPTGPELLHHRKMQPPPRTTKENGPGCHRGGTDVFNKHKN